MNSHNEKEKLLTFGKTSVDVSNVPYGRIVKASNIWNKIVQMEDTTPTQINKMCDSVGCYLVRQPFEVLNRRFTFFKSVKEYIKRLFITPKFIYRFNKKQYDEFQGWVYELLTGKKKEDLQTDSEIMKFSRKLYRTIESQNIDQDECLELLQMLVVERANQSKDSTQDHKA